MLTGGAGHDSLAGNAGDDALVGEAGDDTLVGGVGDDVYLFDADSALGTDALVESSSPTGGVDLLDFSQTTGTGVTVDLELASQSVHANLALTLSLSAFERIIGSTKNDTLRGNGLSNVLIGGAGVDSLFGLGGRDLLVGGTAADTLRGGDEDDILISGTFAYFSESTRVLNRAAVHAIMAEWTRTDPGSDYATRIDRLRNGGGLNGSTLLSSLTVLSDGSAIDTLFGEGGFDWFWKFGSDATVDFAIASEILN